LISDFSTLTGDFSAICGSWDRCSSNCFTLVGLNPMTTGGSVSLLSTRKSTIAGTKIFSGF